MRDVLVLGLGAMGSAVAFELATRGVNVVGIDAYAPPHTLGSTHGKSRIIREAYFEHPSYVPLVQRAFARWAALAEASGARLYTPTGGLSIGTPESPLVAGVLRSAHEHGLAIDVLTREAVVERFPAFALHADMIGVFEHNAGMLAPEECIRAYLDLAARHGAVLRTNERVVDIRRRNDGFIVSSETAEYVARRVVMCAGAWNAPLLDHLGINVPLVVTRQTMHWLAPRGDPTLRAPERFPVTLVDHGEERIFYAMPDTGDGIKAAIHHEGTPTLPGTVDRAVHAADRSAVAQLAGRFVPSVAGPIVESAVCLYTNTPDHDFAIGVPRAAPGVVLVSACSGHGFKFASAIGQAAAQLALDQSPDVDLSHFSVDRFPD